MFCYHMDLNTRLLTTCDFSRAQFELEFYRLNLHYQRKSRARRLMKDLNRRCLIGISVTITTERGFHAFHTEPIFSTSRTDQSNVYSKYPHQFFQKNVNLQVFFFFFGRGGGGGDLFREILAFLRRVKCAPD